MNARTAQFKKLLSEHMHLSDKHKLLISELKKARGALFLPRSALTDRSEILSWFSFSHINSLPIFSAEAKNQVLVDELTQRVTEIQG